MYKNLEQFKRAAMNCGVTHYPDHSLQAQSIELAFRIYQQAWSGTRLLDVNGKPIESKLTIIGRLARRENGQWIASNEAFPSIDQILKDNLGLMNEHEGATGAVLDSSSWTLLANDAWILGSIQSQTEFHLASPILADNLWSPTENRMTVIARELIAVECFGYTMVRPNPNLEAVAFLPAGDAWRARRATLEAYQAALQALEQRATLLRYLEKPIRLYTGDSVTR